MRRLVVLLALVLAAPAAAATIHGTNQPWSIGHSVSNGCIRIPNPAAKRLFWAAVEGTPVIIHV